MQDGAESSQISPMPASVRWSSLAPAPPTFAPRWARRSGNAASKSTLSLAIDSAARSRARGAIRGQGDRARPSSTCAPSCAINSSARDWRAANIASVGPCTRCAARSFFLAPRGRRNNHRPANELRRLRRVTNAATQTKKTPRRRTDQKNPQADGAAVAHDRGPDQVQSRARAGKAAPRGKIRKPLMPHQYRTNSRRNHRRRPHRRRRIR